MPGGVDVENTADSSSEPATQLLRKLKNKANHLKNDNKQCSSW